MFLMTPRARGSSSVARGRAVGSSGNLFLGGYVLCIISLISGWFGDVGERVHT